MGRKKKQEVQEEIVPVKLKEIIKEMDFSDTTKISVHVYNGKTDMIEEVAKVPKQIMNKEVIKIFPHSGGVDNDYNLYRFIVR